MYRRFKELRLERGLTQKELAEELGISLNILRCVELRKRKCKLEYLIKYSHFFDVSLDYIVRLTDQRTRHEKRRG